MADLTDHELTRRNLWIRAACTPTGSSYRIPADEAAKHADKVLVEFDKRFNEPEEPKPIKKPVRKANPPRLRRKEHEED